MTDLEFQGAALLAARDRAEADVRTAQAALAQAQLDLAQTEIRAPIGGFVLERLVDPGDVVNAAQEAPVMFKLASDLKRIRVKAAVAERDIGRIGPDMGVRFRVDAYPEEAFEAEVLRTLRTPIEDGRFVSYAVELAAEDPEERLYPGMTASVEFVRAEADAVLAAPLTALYYTPEDYVPDIDKADMPPQMIAQLAQFSGDEDLTNALLFGFETGSLAREGYRRVFVMTEEGPAKRRVRVGAEDREQFEILPGGEVAEGDLLVLAERPNAG
ncbi:MAG: efflux RND transporter periplasmic adaptor subunit [Maricaulaceae bacterium]